MKDEDLTKRLYVSPDGRFTMPAEQTHVRLAPWAYRLISESTKRGGTMKEAQPSEEEIAAARRMWANQADGEMAALLGINEAVGGFATAMISGQPVEERRARARWIAACAIIAAESVRDR